MPKKLDPMPLYVWGSSHACDRHHLPACLKAEFENDPRPTKFIDPPCYVAKGGQRINEELVAKIKATISRDTLCLK